MSTGTAAARPRGEESDKSEVSLLLYSSRKEDLKNVAADVWHLASCSGTVIIVCDRSSSATSA